MKTNADNIETPRRYRNARSDASINKIQKTVEDKFGLPAGSIKIINPNGRKTRSDATVGTLKKNWNKVES